MFDFGWLYRDALLGWNPCKSVCYGEIPEVTLCFWWVFWWLQLIQPRLRPFKTPGTQRLDSSSVNGQDPYCSPVTHILGIPSYPTYAMGCVWVISHYVGRARLSLEQQRSWPLALLKPKIWIPSPAIWRPCRTASKIASCIIGRTMINIDKPSTFGVPYFQTKPCQSRVNPCYFQTNRDSTSILDWP